MTTLEEWFANPPKDEQYKEWIAEDAQRFDVPQEFAMRIHRAEYDPRRKVSSAGAIGPMQLMPDTAKSLGVDPNNDRQNIHGGVKYLRQLLDRFDGDQMLAAAAYNAGPGAVEKYGGVPPYKETKGYLKRIFGTSSAYAYDIPKEQTLEEWFSSDPKDSKPDPKLVHTPKEQTLEEWFSSEEPKAERGVVGDVLHGASRVAGVATGALNAPFAFGMGGFRYANENPEEWAAMPFWKKMVTSFSEGGKSAWESASQEGSYGADVNQAVKFTTGKTVPEMLPESMQWAAPTVEFMASLLLDPGVPLGVAAGMVRKAGTKAIVGDLYETLNRVGKVPNLKVAHIPQQVIDDLGRLEKASAEEKAALQEQLLNILKGRKDYVDDVTQWGERELYKAETKEAIENAPKALPVGQGFEMRSVTADDILSRYSPELTETVQQSSRPALPPAQGFEMKPAMPESRLIKDQTYPRGESYVAGAEQDVEILMQTKQGKLRPPTEHEIKKMVEAKGVYADTPQFQKKLDDALEELTKKNQAAQPVYGAVAGVEVDDEGNVSFDPTKAAAGMAGVFGATKLFGKQGWVNDALRKSPEWQKVRSQIGKRQWWKGKETIKAAKDEAIENYIDRFIVLSKEAPETYRDARIHQSHIDVSVMKLNELKDGLSQVRAERKFFTDYILAHRDMTRAGRGIKTHGITVGDAKKAIGDMETAYAQNGGDVAKLSGARDAFQNWTEKYILGDLRASGVISQAQFKDIVDNNEWYAAFDVIQNMPEERSMHALPAGEWLSVNSQGVVKSMKGTEKLIDDPIEATVQKFAQAQAIAARNKVAKTLIDELGPSGTIQPIAKSKKDFALLQKAGKNPIMEGDTILKGLETISHFHEGKVHKYAVPKPIGEAMKQVTPWQAPAVFNGLANVFRQSATTMYLPFTVSNARRDFMMAFATAPVYKGTSIGNFSKDWGKGLAEGFKYAFSHSDAVEEYLKHGGGFGFSGEVRSGKQAAKELFRQNPLVTVVKSPFKLIDKLTQTVELAPRMAVHSRAKAIGYSLDDAAFMARNATVDFSRGGKYTKVVNQFVPFLNARVQGRVRLYDALKNDFKNTTTKMLVGATLPGLGAYAYNRVYHSDLYDDIPEYIKQNYFTIITGSEEKDGKIQPKYMVIDKGDIGQVGFNSIEFALDWWWQHDRESASDFLVNMLSDISPVEFARNGEIAWDKAAGSMLPPVVKGGVEAVANKNLYTGLDIVPYQMEKNVPVELQYDERTPELYKQLGNIDLPYFGKSSPKHIQNFAQNLFAGYGREGLSPGAMAEGFVGRFTKTKGGQKESSATEIMRNIEQEYNAVRAYAVKAVQDGDRAKANELMNEWNRGLNSRLREMEKYGYKDKGGLTRDFIFSPQKRKNIFTSRKDERPYLERRMSLR